MHGALFDSILWSNDKEDQANEFRHNKNHFEISIILVWGFSTREFLCNQNYKQHSMETKSEKTKDKYW